MILRCRLAALVLAAFPSGTSSFVLPHTGRQRNSIVTGSATHGTTKRNLSLSPTEVASGLARIPGPLLYPAVFAVCFRIGAALAVIGQPRLPEDDDGAAVSSRLVGSKVIRLPALGSRVRLFYPISEKASARIRSNKHDSSDANYCTDGRATSDGMAGLVGFRQLGLSFLLAHLADARSGCYAEENTASADAGIDSSPTAVLESCEAGAPLLVYSHGYGGNMDMATYFLRAIAQKGVVVAAMEHTDGTASSTVLRDGRRLDFDASLFSLKDGLVRRAQELREAVEYVPTLLPTPGRVYLGGHSYGAPSVLLASQKEKPWDPSIGVSGLILHDPALSMGRGLELPPKLPTVSYVSDEYNRGGVRCGDATYHVRGAFHGNFVDAPLWAPLWVMRALSVVLPVCGLSDPDTVHKELAESARAFCFAPPDVRRLAETIDVGGQPLFERVD